MIKTSIANSLLDSFFGNSNAGSNLGLNGICYLGLSTTIPVLNGGVITNFTEPVGNNYARKLVGNSLQASTRLMDSAANAEIANGTNEIHFNECLGNSWGEIMYLGIFTAATGGQPVLAGPLVDSSGEPTTITVNANQVPLFRVDQLTAEIK